MSPVSRRRLTMAAKSHFGRQPRSRRGKSIVVDAVDAREHAPAAARIFVSQPGARRLTTAGASARRRAQSSGRNGVVALMTYLPKPSPGRALRRGEMRVDDILDRDPAKQIFVRLGIIVGVSGARLRIVILLGKEARGPQHDCREPLVAVKQLAEILGRRLGDAVDVLGRGRDSLVDPGRGRARRRLQRIAEGAGGAGHDESPDASPRRRLDQDERPHDVRLDERRARMGSDMRLVQRRGVEDRVGAVDAARDAGAVGDRADLVGERPRQDIEPNRRTARGAQRAHERFAEMP